MIDRTSPIPLYFQVSEDIREKIKNGTHSEGDKLPSEHELRAEFGVSRSVIRQALASLMQDRLIVTERGRGAFVRQTRVPITLTQKLDPLQEGMAQSGYTLTTKVIQQKLIDAPVSIAEKIGDNKAIYLKRLRYADGEILLVVENYIPYGRAKELLDFGGLDSMSLYAFLKERCGIVVSKGQRRIEVAKANDDVAEMLGLAPGERVLFNREQTFDQEGNVVEYFESWHHPDRTHLNISLERNCG